MFLVDTHVHSSEGSPCGKIPATEIVRLYKENGYDGIVLTNHFNEGIFDRRMFSDKPTWREKVEAFTESYLAAKKAGDEIGLRVFFGLELKNFESYNEYLIYGATKEFLLENERLFDRPLTEIRKLADENGLIIIQAHPFRPNNSTAPAELIDGVEGFNGHFNHDSNNDAAIRFGKKIGKIITSGSDCHKLADLGNGGIIFESEPETDDFAKALKTIPYELKQTEQQQLDILMLDLDDEDTAEPMDILYLAQSIGAKFLVLNYNGDEDMLYKVKKALKKTPSVLICNGKIISGKECIIGRTQIFISSYENNNIFEPSVIVCEEVTKEFIDKISGRNISAVIAAKSDDEKPYKIEWTSFCGFDNTFSDLPRGYLISIMGPETYIENIIY